MLSIALVLNPAEAPVTLSRNQLIRSYGFIEQLSINKNFLQDSFELALKITGFDGAAIGLIDDDNEHVHALGQEGVTVIPIDQSIGKWAVQENELIEIQDTLNDARTRDMQMSRFAGDIKHFVAAPLINKDGVVIGVLSISKSSSGERLTVEAKDVLIIIAKQVMNTFEEQKKLIALIKEINQSFKPAECVDLSCLYGELGHLQIEVIEQSKVLTAQKNLLEISNDELKSFAHVVAHDIKTPLKTITNFAGLIEKTLKKGGIQKSEEYLNYIKQASTNLNEFVEDILQVAQAGQEAEFAEVSLFSILETVILNLHSLLQETNTEIKLPKKDVLVKGQSSQLVQLFQNLIANGIKYQDGKKTPSITIGAKAKEGKVKISVKDNGIGIEKKSQKEIFKPFKRVHENESYEGLGIGLATCQKIVQDHGSEIKVKSKVGKGTKFKFNLNTEL